MPALAEPIQTPFPVGGYTVSCCGDRLIAYGGLTPAAKPTAGARPSTAPAGRRAPAACLPTSALQVLDLGEGVWRELPADTEPPPARSGHACVATGEFSMIVHGGTGGSGHQKLADVWALELQRTESTTSLRMELSLDAWTAEHAKAVRDEVAAKAAAAKAAEAEEAAAAAAAAAAGGGKKGGKPPPAAKKGGGKGAEPAAEAVVAKPVMQIANVRSAIAGALGLPPECLEIEAEAPPPPPAEGEAPPAPPEGTKVFVRVLPLLGVGLKTLGVDGAALPAAAMAAFKAKLEEASPPKEEEAAGGGGKGGKGGGKPPVKGAPDPAAGAAKALKGKQICVVGYALLSWRLHEQKDESVVSCASWTQPKVAPANEPPPQPEGGADAKGGKGAKASPANDVDYASLPPQPDARCGHTATLTAGGVVVFGGSGARALLDDVWRLQLRPELRWEKPATQGTPPSARAYHSAVCRVGGGGAAAVEGAEVEQQQLVVFGGNDGRRRLGDVQLLCLPQLIWSSPNVDGVPPSPRCWHAAAAVPGAPWRMVVFGGVDAKGRPQEETWGLRALGEVAVPEAAPPADAKGGKGAPPPKGGKGAPPPADEEAEPVVEPPQFAWTLLPEPPPPAALSGTMRSLMASSMRSSLGSRAQAPLTAPRTAPRCVAVGGSGGASGASGGGAGGAGGSRKPGALVLDDAMPPRVWDVWTASDLRRAEEPPTDENAPAQLVMRRVEVRGLCDGAAARMAADDGAYVVLTQGGVELARSDARLDSGVLHISTALRATLLVPPQRSGDEVALPEAADPTDRPLQLQLWRRAFTENDEQLASLCLGAHLKGATGSVRAVALDSLGGGGGGGGGAAAAAPIDAAMAATAKALAAPAADAVDGPPPTELPRPASAPIASAPAAAAAVAAALDIDFDWEFASAAEAAEAAAAGPEVLSLQEERGDEHVGHFVDGLLEGKGVCVYANGARYEGEWVKGLRHGHGEFREHGAVYRGGWADGQQSGEGVWSYPDGSEYRGPLKKGMRHGHGVFTDAEGGTYEGGWKLNLREGQGVLVEGGGLRTFRGGWHHDLRHGHGVSSERESFAARAEIYDGEFLLGNRHGRGRLQMANGDVYNGQWRSGSRNGHGELVGSTTGERYSGKWIGDVRCGVGHQDTQLDEAGASMGEVYEGQWSDGERHGTGTCRYPDGATTYVGEWRHGKRHGDGCLSSEGGDASYEGLWNDGERHGHGKQVYSTGEVYFGQFHADERHGKGELLGTDGSRYDGLWWEGVQHGEGTHQSEQGDVYTGQWEGGGRSGLGRLVTATGEVYEGEWADGERCGRGRCTFSRAPEVTPPPLGFALVSAHTAPPACRAGGGGVADSLYDDVPSVVADDDEFGGADLYDGEWLDGMRHGEGRFVGVSGDVYTGQWEDDKRHGRGRCVYGNGNVYEGQWLRGKPSGEGALATVPLPPSPEPSPPSSPNFRRPPARRF